MARPDEDRRRDGGCDSEDVVPALDTTSLSRAALTPHSGVFGRLVACVSLPVLWIVMLGMLVTLHAPASKRPLARRVVRDCGGWPSVPFTVAAWAWRCLQARPYAVATVGLLVSIIATMMGGLQRVPLALVTAAFTAMVVPAMDENVLKRLFPDRSEI